MPRASGILFVKSAEAAHGKDVHNLLGIVHTDPDNPKHLHHIEKEFPDLVNPERPLSG